MISGKDITGKGEESPIDLKTTFFTEVKKGGGKLLTDDNLLEAVAASELISSEERWTVLIFARKPIYKELMNRLLSNEGFIARIEHKHMGLTLVCAIEHECFDKVYGFVGAKNLNSGQRVRILQWADSQVKEKLIKRLLSNQNFIDGITDPTHIVLVLDLAFKYKFLEGVSELLVNGISGHRIGVLLWADSQDKKELIESLLSRQDFIDGITYPTHIVPVLDRAVEYKCFDTVYGFLLNGGSGHRIGVLLWAVKAGKTEIIERLLLNNLDSGQRIGVLQGADSQDKKELIKRFLSNQNFIDGITDPTHIVPVLDLAFEYECFDEVYDLLLNGGSVHRIGVLQWAKKMENVELIKSLLSNQDFVAGIEYRHIGYTLTRAVEYECFDTVYDSVKAGDLDSGHRLGILQWADSQGKKELIESLLSRQDFIDGITNPTHIVLVLNLAFKYKFLEGVSELLVNGGSGQRVGVLLWAKNESRVELIKSLLSRQDFIDGITDPTHIVPVLNLAFKYKFLEGVSELLVNGGSGQRVGVLLWAVETGKDELIEKLLSNEDFVAGIEYDYIAYTLAQAVGRKCFDTVYGFVMGRGLDSLQRLNILRWAGNRDKKKLIKSLLSNQNFIDGIINPIHIIFALNLASEYECFDTVYGLLVNGISGQRVGLLLWAVNKKRDKLISDESFVAGIEKRHIGYTLAFAVEYRCFEKVYGFVGAENLNSGQRLCILQWAKNEGRLKLIKNLLSKPEFIAGMDTENEAFVRLVQSVEGPTTSPAPAALGSSAAAVEPSPPAFEPGSSAAAAAAAATVPAGRLDDSKNGPDDDQRGK
jgi:hypothetical protein